MVGGKLGRYDGRRTAFRFDTGPSLLTLPQVFDELFAAPVRRPTCDLVPLDPVVRHVFPDGVGARLVRGPGRASPPGSPPRSAPAAAADWRAAVAAGRAGLGRVLAARAARPRGLAGRRWPGWPGGSATSPRSRPAGRCAALGRAHLRDPRLRMLLDRYATYAGADPRRAPAALVAIPYAELAFGGWYLPRRAGARSPTRCCRAAWTLGVAVAHRHRRSTGIDAAGGRVRGVTAGRRRAGRRPTWWWPTSTR